MTALAFGGIYGWTTWWIAGGLLAFVVAAPLFLWVERRRSGRRCSTSACSATGSSRWAT